MGCQSLVILGNNLTFTITTHDPDTGELTDADAAPTYRVYEDETAVAILTGTMSTLDTANTTGFYGEQIACTAGNGFEAGKSYNIYIEATVDADTGGISYGFTVFSAAPLTAAETQSEVDDALNTQLADSIPADGTRPTLRQAIYMVVQYLNERAVSGTTVTVKKVDGSTSLYTLTIDDSSDPTSITRAT